MSLSTTTARNYSFYNGIRIMVIHFTNFQVYILDKKLNTFFYYCHHISYFFLQGETMANIISIMLKAFILTKDCEYYF